MTGKVSYNVRGLAIEVTTLAELDAEVAEAERQLSLKREAAAKQRKRVYELSAKIKATKDGSDVVNIDA